jgi:glutathione S-transferase
MLKVYGIPKSRSSRITWLMEELNQPYEFHLIDFSKGDNRSSEFLAINPAGKVPAIDDDGFVMIESGAIVNYLADKHAGEGLIPPAGSEARGLHEQWSYFALTELEQPLWTQGKHRFAIPEEHRVPAVIETAAWEFQKALALLSNGLGDKDYILGNQFQAVDVQLGHTLLWGSHFEQPIEQENLKAYFERVTARPALARAMKKEQASTAQ